MAPTPNTPPSTAKQQASNSALKEYLQLFGARLIQTEGTLAVAFTGEVTMDRLNIPYTLVPTNGVLAKIGRWENMAVAEQIKLARSRVNAKAAEQFRQEIHAFVLKARLLADQHQVDPSPFWSGLVSRRQLASQRFQVIEERIIAAAQQLRERENAALAQASVKLALYPETFELAHSMRRRFIAVLGPTNSGKTHQAMQALAAAPRGVYLAPLRLLALENYERLSEQQIPVSLITGEERRIHPFATHVTSTIEMVDTQRRVDVAVIDEVQMLEDPERGAAWTAAICGVPADVIYLVGATAAKPALVALAKRLGCPLEVLELERMSPLTLESQAIGSVSNLKRGDAIIAFSRKEVLYWGDLMHANGLSVATIYGNLSPEVRRAQAKRFREGAADVLAGTDAIGMGLNLPVSRIVFTTVEKFDGQEQQIIEPWLAQQIAGRAGRFGIHEAGFVAGFDENTHRSLRKLLKTRVEPLPDHGFRVAPSLQHLRYIAQATGENRLEKLLQLFSKNIDVHDEFFMPTNLTEQIERAVWLDTLTLSLADRYLLSLVPVSTRVSSLAEALLRWAQSLAHNEIFLLEEEDYRRNRFPLQAAEDACKKYAAYAWLSYRKSTHFPDNERALELARITSIEIDRMLQAQNARDRAGRHARSRRSPST